MRKNNNSNGAPNSINDIIGFDIKYEPVENSKTVSIQLAQALADAAWLAEQSQVYSKQSQEEKRRAEELNFLLIEIKNWRKQRALDEEAGTAKVLSRMEPMLSYDVKQIEDERTLHKEQSQEFLKKSQEFSAKAKEEKLKSTTLQTKLARMKD